MPKITPKKKLPLRQRLFPWVRFFIRSPKALLHLLKARRSVRKGIPLSLPIQPPQTAYKLFYGLFVTPTAMDLFTTLARSEKEFIELYCRSNHVNLSSIIDSIIIFQTKAKLDTWFQSYNNPEAPGVTEQIAIEPAPKAFPLSLSLSKTTTTTPASFPLFTKDTVMQNIIKNKDSNLFHVWEGEFSPEERTYIKEKLNLL